MSTHALSVLLADPDPSTCAPLRRRLEAAGYEVTVASTASEVIGFCSWAPPDVLVIDVNLPDMNGFDVCTLARHDADETDLTVILTGEPHDELTRAYFEPMAAFAGSDYCVSKPFDTTAIVNIVEEIAAGASSRPSFRATFPTHVRWPSGRRPLAAAVR
ncbi:MAG: response regulator [Planctomycetota bacterium]|nr:MAG: response regulator [Planctomycetota bacterium]